ncbi:MAG: hypothetical protein IKB09_13170 [Oscillospiraceae bacterium]|nr:hypothetical protein [Oscillospiraceae bacterium]
MNQLENVVDLVKAAFIVLIVKAMASYSAIIPWNSIVDNLCIAFAVCVMLAKICMLTFTLNKLITLAVMALVTLYTCASMGQYDLMVTLIAICLLIDEDLEEYIGLMLKVQAFILLGHIAISGFLSLVGSTDSFWHMTDHRLRFNGGFLHANILSNFILSCMLMFAWKRFGRITRNQFGWMACITVLSFVMSRSRTGLILNISLLLLLFLSQQESDLPLKGVNAILPLLFPGLAAMIFWVQKQYTSGNGIALFLDDLLTGRIKYAAYAYLRSGTTWLPRPLDYVDSGVVSWTPEWNLNTFTFDNLYSFLFMQMGIIWIAIFTGLIALVCKKFDFRNKLFVLIWVLYAIVEVHGLNCFKFFPLLLLTTLLSEKGVEGHPSHTD